MAESEPGEKTRTEPVAKPARARVWRWLGLVGGLLLLLGLALGVWLMRAIDSGDLLTRVVHRAQLASGGRLSIESPEGSPLGAMRASRIVWKDEGTEVIVEAPSITLSPWALLQQRLQFDGLQARRIEVINTPEPGPAVAPASLHLPLGLEVNDARVDELVIRQRGEPDGLVLRDLRADLRHGGGHWRSDSFSLRADAGLLSGSFALGDRPPYAASGHLLAETHLGDQALVVNADLGGTLTALALDVRTQRNDASLAGKIRLAPFAHEPLAGADLSMSGLDLSRFESGWPSTRLSGTISVEALAGAAAAPGTGPGRESASVKAARPLVQLPPLTGSFAVTNANVGTLDAGRLPLQSLRGNVRTVGDRLDLSALELAGPPGRLTGTVGLQLKDGKGRPGFDVRLNTTALDLRQVHAKLLATALGGSVRVQPEGEGLAFETDLSDQPRALALKARARLLGQTLTLASARLQAHEGLAEFAGTVGVVAPHRLVLSGSLARLDPSRFARVAPGMLSGQWQLSGKVLPTPDLDAKLVLADSRWRGQPLSGQVAGHVGPGERLSGVDTALRLGGANVRVRGDLGASGDRLKLDLEAVRLAAVDPRLGGVLSLDVELRNRLRLPGVSGTALVRDLRLDEHARARLVRARVDAGDLGALAVALAQAGVPGMPGLLNALPQNAPSAVGVASVDSLSLQAQVEGLTLQGRDIDSLSADLSGTVARHSLALRAQAARLKLDTRVRLEGGLATPRAGAPDAARWQGSLLELVNVGQPGVRMTNVASLQMGQGQSRLEGLVAEIDGADGARLQLDRLSLDAGRLEVRGSLTRVPLRWADPWLVGQGVRSRVPDALRMGARFDLVRPQAGSPALTGQVVAFRESGDLVLDVAGADGSAETLRAGLSALDARITLAGDRMDATLDLKGDRLGSLRGQAQAPLAWSADSLLPDLNVALGGRVDLAVPSLAFTRALVGDAWRLDGSVNAMLALGGRLNAPRLSGTIGGSGLLAVQRELGMRLTDGELQATIKDNQLDIRTLTFASGKGSVRISGSLRPDERSEAVVSLQAVPIPLGAGQRLVVSGESRAEFAGGTLRLRGNLRADEGVIEITSGNAPGVSDDVVLTRGSTPVPGNARAVSVQAGGSGAAAEGRPERGFRILSNLQIDLGDRFRVFGAGVEARLAGQVTLRGQLPDAPRVTGTVRVVQGTYAGFGQKLEIERGNLVFNGPVDNPSIDLVAYRRFLPVEAGVALSGTAQVPKLTLVSKPDVPEADKLSWLVLGVASDTSRGGQGAAMQAAAAVLMSAGGKNGASPSLASSVGLDVLSVRTGPASGTSGGSAALLAQDSIVTLGKRISQRLFLSYEQSLRGLQNLFRLQYEISERLSIRTRLGTENAIDLIWTRRYD